MININLLPEELRPKIKRRKVRYKIEFTYLLYLVPVLVSIFIGLHIFLFAIGFLKSAQFNSLNRKWQDLEKQRELLKNFKMEFSILSKDNKLLQQLVRNRISWSEKLNKLSAYLPADLWFRQLSVSSNNFKLEGSVVSLERKEMSSIKGYIDELKKDAGFFSDFNNIEVDSMSTRRIGGYDVVDFTLLGGLKEK